MRNRLAITLLLVAAATGAGSSADTAHADEIVVDFEQATIGKPVPTWTEKGVVFDLAGPPAHTKAVGRIMFFPHLATNHKGLLNAMATEQAVPVRATLPAPASEVTVVFWASTGCPALLEALDSKGEVVGRASVAAAPGRKAPADPVPFFQLSVKAAEIVAIRYSGPRDGEFLAADEIRITTIPGR
ncbi:MAG TPA: hypothetical protein VMF52_20140 [Steroidobacteraceae bacterium]|nr:hypothetical protein [Steroidobacteraceae bacterium]